jgi:hypothetical protein
MMKVMITYPALRVEPTEHGSRFALYWMVRAWCATPKGMATAVARCAPMAALPAAWQLVRLGASAQDMNELAEALEADPRIRVRRMTMTEEDR